jgi:predicted NUDIX family phosphoesterase
MSEPLAERVLVVPTAVFHQLGVFQGFRREVAAYLPRLLDPANLYYLARAEAEQDPSYKQLIPYVVLRWREQVFHYTRGAAGTEARLRALRSIGVGGHICAEDAAGDADPYCAGLLREIAEEVELQSPYSESVVGLINDDRTPVGQVHLGVVHVFDLQEPRVNRREQALAESGFAALDDLRRDRERFETWSQFLLDDAAFPHQYGVSSTSRTSEGRSW